MIRRMKITDLKANPKNPRIIKDDKFKKLVKSLQEFPEMMAKRPMVCVTDTAYGKLFPLGGKSMKRATTVEFGLYAKKINILIEEAYEEGY